MNNFTQLQATTLTKADRCVKCGLCSAQCPTYSLDGSENESPRGRIALAQALVNGQLSDFTLIEKHFNNCLLCQRCEKICPSGVEFGEIMSNSRAILDKKQHKADSKLIRWTARRTHKDWAKIGKVSRILQKTGVLRLIPALSSVQQYIKTTTPTQFIPARKNTPAGRVALFTGCTSHLLDNETINNARQLLNLCGYEVILPETQVCCGALPKHKGQLTTAKQCETSNAAAFEKHNGAIVFLATACGAALKTVENEHIRTQAINITSFLNAENALAQLKFKPLKKRVLIHEPCSEKNALRETGNTQTLLSALPDADIVTLKETTGCCGAAGEYMLTHVDMARTIRAPLLDDIKAINPDIIVTTNYTCGIHIKNGLQELDLDIPVIHPIKLLLNQIKHIE